MKLNAPAPLPDNARRAGLWLYVERPMELYGVWLELRDADGRVFDYRLAKLAAWAKGWRYLDTFTFGKTLYDDNDVIRETTSTKSPPTKRSQNDDEPGDHFYKTYFLIREISLNCFPVASKGT